MSPLSLNVPAMYSPTSLPPGLPDNLPAKCGDDSSLIYRPIALPVLSSPNALVDNRKTNAMRNLFILCSDCPFDTFLIEYITMVKKERPGHVRKIAQRLLRWYRKEGRDLPWRRTADPYAIWISEIMLQQTQVSTVIPYYERFMAAFPTVADLAHAPLGTVLKVWEGLGYYARARNLHRAAKMILEQHQVIMPEDIGALASLPGIGRSTAGAIVSIAYGKKAPILDGNVRRVLCRLFAIRQNPSLLPVQKRLWGLSEGLVPEKDPRSFNQALMDLGAMVCLPKDPDCPACCLKPFCLAYQKGIQKSLPIKSPGKKIPHYHVAVGVIWKGKKVLITQRPLERLLRGLSQ